MQPQSSGWGNPTMPPVRPMSTPQTAAQLRKRPWGLIIALIISILLFLGAVGFAAWAYSGMQDYKNNVNQKVNAAVTIAVKNEDSKKDQDFVNQQKSPYKTYKGPDDYGSVQITYPKTWSAYVNQVDRANIPVDGYFYPDWVPGAQSGTEFALRVQVSSQSYSTELQQFQTKTKSGKVSVSPYKAPQVSNVLGSRVQGEINIGQQDVMVLFPVRDKTLKIWTESPQFVGDFDNIIMANLTFSP